MSKEKNLPIKYCPMCNSGLILISDKDHFRIIKCSVKDKNHEFSYSISKKDEIFLMFIKKDIYNIIWEVFKRKEIVIYTINDNDNINYIHNNIDYIEPQIDNLSDQINKIISRYKIMIAFY